MSAFKYEKVETICMKVCGYLDSDTMKINIDGVEKKLSTLLSQYNGSYIEFSVKTKDKTLLDEPIEKPIETDNEEDFD